MVFKLIENKDFTMKKILVILFLSLLSFSLDTYAYNISSDFYFTKIDNSIENYKKNIKSLGADKAFYLLQKDYEKYVSEMNSNDTDKISQLQCSYKRKYLPTIDNRNNKINLQNYHNKGLGLYCSEAMSIFTVNYNWLENNYGTGLSKKYKLWLKYLKKPVPFDEGMLNTNKKTLNKQIKNLEKFIYYYPDFVGIQDVENELRKLREAQ